MHRAVPLLPREVDLGRDRHTGWGVRTQLNLVGPSGWWRGAPHKEPCLWEAVEVREKGKPKTLPAPALSVDPLHYFQLVCTQSP